MDSKKWQSPHRRLNQVFGVFLKDLASAFNDFPVRVGQGRAGLMHR
jgi:hypothetical protein